MCKPGDKYLHLFVDGSGKKKAKVASKEQKLKEAIVGILCPYYAYCDTKRNYGCFTKRDKWSLCVSVERANQILSILKAHKMVFVADDQTLPELISRDATFIAGTKFMAKRMVEYDFVRVVQIQEESPRIKSHFDSADIDSYQ